MPLIQYKEFRFQAKSQRLITIANRIIDEYVAKGFTLTLRQLYYQFVARGVIPNTMKDYKNLGNVINDARLAGLIDWDAIEDRTRNLEALTTWDSPADVLISAAEQFRYDYWDSQDIRIEVWVEKEALVGVVERSAFKYRCGMFACRGYTSQSESWRAGQRFKEYNDRGQAVKIIHLGDHDPSGIDMTRDNRERLNMFSEYGDVEVIRLALNKDQVDRYNPPPNPAKLTDTRANEYIAEFGENSWELDALDPEVIDRIISQEIELYIDWDKWNKVKAREKKARKDLLALADNFPKDIQD